MRKVKKYNIQKPDPKFIRQVLWQAFGGFGSGLKQIYAEASCLHDMEVEDWEKLKSFLIKSNLVEESLEEEYFRLTSKGYNFLYG